MAHGEVEPLAEGPQPGAMQPQLQPQLQPQHQQQQQQQQQQHASLRRNVSAMGSRRIFSPSFKLQVLDSYRHDVEVKGNQRATARKYSIHRRQIQKWLQCEDSLRSSCGQQQQQQHPADSPSSSSSSSSTSSTSSACSTSSGASSTTASPAASPLKELEPLAPAAAGHSGAPASPTLNLGFARLRGDTELGARQSAPPPPPPPPPTQPPVSAAAAAAAAQAIAQAQQQAAGYQRLHVQAHVQTHVQPGHVQPYPRLLHQPAELHLAELYPGQLQLHRQQLLLEPKREPFSPPRFASPEPSQLESLPPSPERSCSAASSDSEMDGGQSAGRRRSFPLRFKIDVLDAFHGEAEVAGNQRATARKFRINRRQVQKWLGQESELRGVAELGQGRQRLGPQPELAPTPPDCYDYPALTPPYHDQPPAAVATGPLELKRPLYALDAQDAPPPPPPPKRFCPVQEQPLCLVKPKGSAAPAPNKDAILFKPYLDNPVSKREPSPPALNNNNNNSPDAYNLNDAAAAAAAAATHQQLSLQLSFNPPLHWQQQQPQHHQHQYADVQPVRSAFVRYPTSVHYA